MDRSTWIVTGVAALLALALGFTGGWFGHRTHVASIFASAAEEPQAVEYDYVEEPANGPEEGHGAEPAAPAAPPAGEPADGVFEYEVTAAETSGTFNDDDCGERYTAVGEYVVMTVRAQNVGQAPAHPPADSWSGVYAYTADGVQFAAADEMCLFADEVNPGNGTEYTLVFDVPAGTELTVLELTADGASGVAVVPVP